MVAEAVILDRQIADMIDRLDVLKDRLVALAEVGADSQVPTDGGGWSVTFEGLDGCVARVTQEGPRLRSSVSSEKDVAKIKDAAGSFFGRLFVPSIAYKPVSGFRAEAEALLARGASKLIKLVTTKGATKVSYETKNG